MTSSLSGPPLEFASVLESHVPSPIGVFNLRMTHNKIIMLLNIFHFHKIVLATV